MLGVFNLRQGVQKATMVNLRCVCERLCRFRFASHGGVLSRMTFVPDMDNKSFPVVVCEALLTKVIHIFPIRIFYYRAAAFDMQVLDLLNVR